jgi:glyoxylase-like metal-dependent hydrolase (beta-lactamase superfamily II)
MATIPLEDNFSDILGKAQRGLKLSDEQLAKRAGVSLSDLGRAQSGECDENVIRKLASALNLRAAALIESANRAWAPNPIAVPGLAQLNTPYRDMTVNCYLAWDTKTREAVVFDTGADCGPVLQFVKANQLALKLILLTHTHPDHVADLARLKRETGAPAHVCQLEAIEGAEPFSEGQSFQAGGLRIGTRLTSGHSAGGITYVITGLARPVAVVGDAIFAGSMGGGMISYADAINHNRNKILSLPNETILCPGHGPLTSVGEEKLHNPFFPDLQKN